MRAIVVRQRLVLAAAAAAGAVLLAACGSPSASPSPTSTTNPAPTGSQGPVTLKPGTVLVSNGTTTVKIGDQLVAFPTTVTDAVFSPDGSRIAFVDGDGNIATAHPDGSGMIVLTKKKPGVTRSGPAWWGPDIAFAYSEGGAAPKIYAVIASDSDTVNEYRNEEAQSGPGDGPENGNTGPSTSVEIGAGVEFAYQHQSPQGSDVWVVDTNQRSPSGRKIAAGSSAALSPDGTRIAFVGTNGQVSVMSTVEEKPTAVQLTFGVSSPAHLAWSADGTRLAFRTASDVQSVSATVPAGATSNPSTQISTGPGVPTFVPASHNRLMRLADDPVAASVAGSKLRWPTQKEYFQSEGNRANGALLTGSKAPLRAAGSMPGRSFAGPLLINAGSSLDPRVKAELGRIFGALTSDARPTVTIVGGTDVVSQQTENALKAIGYETSRIAVADIATLDLPPDVAGFTRFYVVDLDDAAGLANVVSVGPNNFASDGFLLFSQGGAFPEKTKTLLNGVTGAATIVPLDSAGAQAASASWTGKPKGLTVGQTVGTNTDRLRAFGGAVNGVVVVDRASVIDVLIASSVAASHGYAVLAVDATAPLDPGLTAWLDASSGSIDQVIVVNTRKTLSQAVVNAVAGAVSGQLGYTESAA